MKKVNKNNDLCLEIKLNSASKEEQYHFQFPNIADFIFSEDNKSLAIWSKGDFATTSHLLLDHVCPYLLSRFNPLVLHAGCVTKDEKSIIFCGHSGSGKSTISGKIIENGWNLVSDDLACFNSDYQLLPTYGSIRLWKDSAETMSSYISESQTRLSQRSDKQKLKLKGNLFSSKAAAFPSAIFLLSANSKDSGFNIEPYSMQQSLIDLISSSFLLEPKDSSRQFIALQEILKNSKIYKLSYKQTETSAQEIAKAINKLQAH